MGVLRQFKIDIRGKIISFITALQCTTSRTFQTKLSCTGTCFAVSVHVFKYLG